MKAVFVTALLAGILIIVGSVYAEQYNLSGNCTVITSGAVISRVISGRMAIDHALASYGRVPRARSGYVIVREYGDAVMLRRKGKRCLTSRGCIQYSGKW